MKPEDIRSLDDLSKIPFTVKADLRDNYPFGMVAVKSDEICEIHASSGTTGNPIVGAYTRSDLDVWQELMARSIYTWAEDNKTSYTSRMGMDYLQVVWAFIMALKKLEPKLFLQAVE